MKNLINTLVFAGGLLAICNNHLHANEPVITVKSKSELTAPIIVMAMFL